MDCSTFPLQQSFYLVSLFIFIEHSVLERCPWTSAAVKRVLSWILSWIRKFNQKKDLLKVGNHCRCYPVRTTISFSIAFHRTLSDNCFTPYHLLINDQCSQSYRNQSIDLHCKSIDWFLYDGEHWSLMG